MKRKKKLYYKIDTFIIKKRRKKIIFDRFLPFIYRTELK